MKGYFFIDFLKEALDFGLKEVCNYLEEFIWGDEGDYLLFEGTS
jgi:hypothetical protein